MRRERIDPTSQPRPLYDIIYAALRENILDLRLPSGLVLGEATVARAFNASRVPAGAALKRLRDEGLISSFDGRGYVVGPPGSPPFRRDLIDAGLVVPGEVAAARAIRNRREHIYPEVEHTVATCLAYGRFQLNESALADHYGVSRTVAHEVLTRLERSGLVAQDTNQRWYAGPLTAGALHDHYEIRWLLEPLALEQALDDTDPTFVRDKLKRLMDVDPRRMTPPQAEELEGDIHVDIILRCRNERLRDTIRRSQLPIIATHSTFERLQNEDELRLMAAEHAEILTNIIKGRRKAAMKSLEHHLRRSLEPNIALLERLDRLPEKYRRPYLVAVE